MALLPAPQNLTVICLARPGDITIHKLLWDPVAGAASYKVHRNDDRHTVGDAIGIEDVYTAPINVVGGKNVFYVIVEAGTMDVFYYVTAVNSVEVEGIPSDTLTRMDPYAARLIEYVDAIIGDDFDLEVYSLTPFQKKLAIDIALAHINSTPARTSFSYANYPRDWRPLLIWGGAFQVLRRQALLEKAMEMNISDSGSSWEPPPMSATMLQIANEWRDMFFEQTKIYKRNFRPSPLGLGSLQAIYGTPALNRFRHLRSHRVI